MWSIINIHEGGDKIKKYKINFCIKLEEKYNYLHKSID